MSVIYTYMICKKHTLGPSNLVTLSHSEGGERSENDAIGSLSAPKSLQSRFLVRYRAPKPPKYTPKSTTRQTQKNH